VLSELHTQGHTVILVTHDPNVVAHANRVIEVQDGRIVSDSATTDTRALITATAIEPESAPPSARTSVRVTNMLESFGMALRSMMAHKLRTLLTMLGIIIGIASVVSVVALGAGAKQRILADVPH
jgi:macrolide transport system ATP-binding/permease protein